VEHTNNSYIPPKNVSISLDFHNENIKVFKRYISESDAKINYQNPVLNSKKDKIYIEYIEPPFIVDEPTDMYILNEQIDNLIK
jgi:hypothetical protein